MKLPILILCLICLCADADMPDMTYYPTQKELKSWGITSGSGSNYFGITNIPFGTNFLFANMISSTNYSILDTTNFLIDKNFHGTIQIGNTLYHIASKTNIVKKTIMVTNVTQELKK